MAADQDNAFDYDLSGGQETVGTIDEDAEDTDQQPAEDKAEKKLTPVEQVRKLASKYGQPAEKQTSTKKTDTEVETEENEDGENNSADSEQGEKASATAGKDKVPSEQSKPSTALIIQAGQLGLSAEEIEEMDAKSLQATVTALAKRKPVETKTVSKAEDTTPAEDSEEEDEDIAEFALDLDPDEYNEEVITTLNGLNKHYHGAVTKLQGQLKAVTTELKALRQERVQEQNEQFCRWFDNTIVELGEDYHELFGQGPMDDLDGDSAPAQNRLTLAREMSRLRHSHPKMEKTQLFKMALKVVFSEHEDKLAAKRYKKQSATTRERTTQRPSHRVSSNTIDRTPFADDGPTKGKDPIKSAVSTLKSKFGHLFK